MAKAAAAKVCSVPGCGKAATHEVFLYDFYPHGENIVFHEQDFTCPYLCAAHAIENETKAKGTREPRGSVIYPYSNRQGAQGFSVYRQI